MPASRFHLPEGSIDLEATDTLSKERTILGMEAHSSRPICWVWQESTSTYFEKMRIDRYEKI